jgi:hypothetical protein
MFVVFIAIYVLLRRRAGAREGAAPPIQWGWLAAIVACAGAAVVMGLMTR